MDEGLRFSKIKKNPMMIMKIYVVCYRASIVDLFSTFKNVLHCD